MVVRHAVTQATAAYRRRFIGRLDPAHYKLFNKLWFSSVGLGVYLSGAPQDVPKYTQTIRDAVFDAVLGGCNHIDTAITHQSQASEQAVGQALASAFAKGYVSRNEIVISARGGTILLEGKDPAGAALYVRQQLIEARVAAADEFAQGWYHCMAPRYLRMQFRRSITNLGLGALDMYYVHVPEVQRAERGPAVFEQRLRAAFAELEAQVSAERLCYYGITAMDGLRVHPDSPAYLSLERIVELARDAGGDSHHFRYVQAPFNLAMREILEYPNQTVNQRPRTPLEAVQELGLVAIGSLPLLRGQLASYLPPEVRAIFPQFKSYAQVAIQFARSAPGLASTVVGMSTPQHIVENLAVAEHPLTKSERLLELLDIAGADR